MAFLSAIVAWSLRHRVFVLLATLAFVVLGVRSAISLPIDAVPDVTNVQVQVITAAPALSPVEVEQYVSVPVERAMAGIPKTTEVRSVSKYGLSVITIVFEDGTDIYFARQLVSERMREAEAAVPKQHGSPEMGPISSGLGEIVQFTVRNDALTPMELEEVLDWQIAPALRTVPGVVEVNSFGGEEKQYQVVLDPGRLAAHELTVGDVVQAIEESNANAGGGYVEHARQAYVIGTDGQFQSAKDIEDVAVTLAEDGTPITIGAIGSVRKGARLRRGAATIDGQGEVVIGVAMMLLGENSRVVTERVKTKLAALESSLPPGTKVEIFYDRSKLVDRTIHTVGKSLLEGALLVVAILFLLLGDLRAGLVVATSIPLSLLFALTLMKLLGQSGNLMSLGAVDFGLIVDGAVIIVENCARRLAMQRAELGRELLGAERSTTVESATLEVRAASVFGEAIIAIVYLPILTLTGTEGKLFRPMATTVLLALAGAFVFSLTVIPVLSSLVLRPSAGDHETWLVRAASRLYRPALRGATRFRAATLTAAVVVLGLAAFSFTRLGAEFIPVLDEGDLVVEARRLPGIGLSETVATEIRLGEIGRRVPEVEHVVSRIGAPEVATDPMGVEQADVYVTLKPRKDWRAGVTKESLAKELGEALEHEVPEVATGVSQPIQMRTNELVAGVRSDVALLLYGPDLAVLSTLGGELAARVRKVPGAVDVRAEQVAGAQYLRIRPDRAALARRGVTVARVNELVETFAVGREAGEMLERERRFGIRVRTDHRFDGDVQAFLGLPLRGRTGLVPLGDVADVSFAEGPAQISRHDQSRRMTVEFNVRGRDLLSVVADAKRAVADVPLPTAYRIEWGGQFEHYTEAKARLLVVVPIALVLIGLLLWVAFRSIRVTLLVYLGVPFAVVGGVLALLARGIPFSISAGVGFIALFGVAVLNGLVLVSFAQDLETVGTAPADAIAEAARLRLRPVLTTALVASLGFVPMAITTEPGGEVQRPLATVVIGGLITATLLTLVVLPSIYSLFVRRPSDFPKTHGPVSSRRPSVPPGSRRGPSAPPR